MTDVNEANLLDHILPNGVRMGDATEADLAHAAAYCEREARKYMESERKLRAVIAAHDRGDIQLPL